jgi:uncharacterized protein
MGIALSLLALFSAAAAVWVFRDARSRMPLLPSTAWALGTLVAVGLVGSAYVLVRPPKAPAWGLGEVLAILVFFVTAIPLLGVFLAPRTLTVPPFGVIVVLAVLQNAVFVAAGLYIVLVKYHLPLSSLGLGEGDWTRRVLLGAVAAGLALLGNFVGQNVTVYALGLVIGQPAADEFVMREEVRTPIYRLLPHVHERTEILLLALLVGVIVPIGEEIFFRGLTYGALRRTMSRSAAVLLSALFFAAVHLVPVEILPILILGVILAYLYDYTGSLIPGMIAHGVNNLAALLLFYHTLPPTP